PKQTAPQSPARDACPPCAVCYTSTVETTAPSSAHKSARNLQAEVWTDPATGLIWATHDNGSDVDWYKAKNYCRDLRLGGYYDWRLPSIDELQGMYDPSARIVHQIKGGIALSGIALSATQALSGPV